MDEVSFKFVNLSCVETSFSPLALCLAYPFTDVLYSLRKAEVGCLYSRVSKQLILV